MLPEHGPISAERRQRRCWTSPTRSRRSGVATSPPRTSAPRARDMARDRGAHRHVVGLARSRGGSGDPSPLTALGVGVRDPRLLRAGIRDRSLRGRSDLRDRARARRLARGEALPARRRRSWSSQTWRRPGGASPSSWARAGSRPSARSTPTSRSLPRARSEGCSMRIPCARLQCRIVAGRREQPAGRRQRSPTCWRRKGILWAPDFVVNAGGLINIAEELAGYDAGRRPPAGHAGSPTRCRRSSQERRVDRDHAAGRRDGAGPRRLAAASAAPPLSPDSLPEGRSTPSGSRPSVVELVEVRGERQAAAGRSARRRVVPGVVEQLVDGARSPRR